ncbi:histidine phosphatase family protein [Acetobacteraceae bacterium KSS8]|uniref:Histidine phosphatase family protein n=1 Tax=Endosaccharibacter trunci TaxID=2812733 RepID=A0ABT1W7A8_9PROT|nr:histidine phosphatase family protein [Acetobacteraceae bacterium KSS8]
MILLRHCQSQFNLHYSRTGRDPGIVDPSLTEEGLRQAERAAARICAEGAPPIRRLLVSPFRRTLQTAAPIAARLGLRAQIVPMARERFAFSCDVGSPPALLAQDWPALDFSALPERWWYVDGRDDAAVGMLESEDSVSRRAQSFVDWILDQGGHGHTLLVSHWGFLLALCGRSLENGEAVSFDPTRDRSGF